MFLYNIRKIRIRDAKIETFLDDFLDDVRSIGSDYQLRLHTNSFVAHGNQGTPQVSVTLLNSGLVMPSFGGVEGLGYYGRVSAVKATLFTHAP
jgi:hypothetical protein